MHHCQHVISRHVVSWPPGRIWHSIKSIEFSKVVSYQIPLKESVVRVLPVPPEIPAVLEISRPLSSNLMQGDFYACRSQEEIQESMGKAAV